MKNSPENHSPIVVFPVSDNEIQLTCRNKLHPEMDSNDLFYFESGLKLQGVRIIEERPECALLHVAETQTMPVTVDSLVIRRLRFESGESEGEIVSPKFVRGIHSAMELKVPYFSGMFPYPSTLAGVYTSVRCCTGCNGGVHDRNLVVLNHHIGGAWSGIWVRTSKTIEAPYPRWQRILCAGGMIAEVGGSTTIVDEGFMVVRKEDEPPHHAPPPLPIQTWDLPAERTESLPCKSLDGAWVEFNELTIESAEWFEASEREPGAVNLPRTEITFCDASGSLSKAWLYQPSGRKTQAGQQLNRLRGFVHAEEPGQYVLLSDKEEDIFL